ncbi:hypothetical protein ACQR3P_08695 [Rhodococcus sp. IEGM1300]
MHRRPGVWLASDGVVGIAITGKPVSYGICVNTINFGMYHRPVGVWLASDGVVEIAITGKPVSYGMRVGITG